MFTTCWCSPPIGSAHISQRSPAGSPAGCGPDPARTSSVDVMRRPPSPEPPWRARRRAPGPAPAGGGRRCLRSRCRRAPRRSGRGSVGSEAPPRSAKPRPANRCNRDSGRVGQHRVLDPAGQYRGVTGNEPGHLAGAEPSSGFPVRRTRSWVGDGRCAPAIAVRRRGSPARPASRPPRRTGFRAPRRAPHPAPQARGSPPRTGNCGSCPKTQAAQRCCRCRAAGRRRRANSGRVARHPGQATRSATPWVQTVHQ